MQLERELDRARAVDLVERIEAAALAAASQALVIFAPGSRWLVRSKHDFESKLKIALIDDPTQTRSASDLAKAIEFVIFPLLPY